MTRYSVKTKDRIFVKDYGFLSFPKNIGKNNGENRSRNLSGNKFVQKLLDHAKQSATDSVKTVSKRVIQKNNKK